MRKIASLVLLLFVASCSPEPRLSPLPPDSTILAFGDSITYGTGADGGSSYPAVLEGLIARRVINAGIPGEVTADGLARLPKVLDEHNPALLVLCHGGNDLLRKMDNGQTTANIRAMIRMARERGIDVVLIAVPRPGIFLKPADFYKQVADESAAAYEGDVLKQVLSDNSLKSDYIHPNARGYRLMAEKIAELMRKRGAI